MFQNLYRSRLKFTILGVSIIVETTKQKKYVFQSKIQSRLKRTWNTFVSDPVSHYYFPPIIFPPISYSWLGSLRNVSNYKDGKWNRFWIFSDPYWLVIYKLSIRYSWSLDIHRPRCVSNNTICKYAPKTLNYPKYFPT